jgi:hypothetical protein
MKLSNSYDDLLQAFNKEATYGINVTKRLMIKLVTPTYEVTYGNDHPIDKIELSKKMLYKTGYEQKCLKISFDDAAPTYVGYFANIEALLKAFNGIRLIHAQSGPGEIVLIDNYYFNKDMAHLKTEYVKYNTLAKLLNEAQADFIARQLIEKLKDLKMSYLPTKNEVLYGESLYRFEKDDTIAKIMEYMIAPVIKTELIDLGITPKMITHQLISNKI